METVESKRFYGLNNVSDPLRLDMGWLVSADNVNITDTGAISKREGYTLAQAGNFTGAFSTYDFTRSYFVVGGQIRTFEGTPLVALTSTAPVWWCEINDQVFFNNGADSGIILADNTVLPWRWDIPGTPAVAAVTGTLPAGTYQVRCTAVLGDGRETGASDPAEITLVEGQALQISGLAAGSNVYIAPADSDVYQLAGQVVGSAFVWNSSPDDLGRDLTNNFLDPLPTGCDVIQAWRGRLYAAQYMPTENQSVLWFSEPLGFHLFNLNNNFIVIPGRILMLAPHDDALVIGTDSRIYSYDSQKLDQVAQYGVVPGQHWAVDYQHTSSDGRVKPERNRVLFWSTRGMCTVMPFVNLTEQQISVAPGIHAGGCVVRTGGQKRYLSILQQGGSPFNPL